MNTTKLYQVTSIQDERDQIEPFAPAPSTLPSDDPRDSQVGGTHYKGMAIQPAEFITRNNLTFLEGCVIKRVCRHRAKNRAEDIRKAIHELELILKLEYPEEP